MLDAVPMRMGPEKHVVHEVLGERLRAGQRAREPDHRKPHVAVELDEGRLEVGSRFGRRPGVAPLRFGHRVSGDVPKAVSVA